MYDDQEGLVQPEEYAQNQGQSTEVHKTISLSGMYENWFLDYASYVILERAVPNILDGLKPVQRRILHSMKELDDGRYNKVANIIGNTMKYHPHGDVSIGDALVQLGQKDLLIDCQGNWGNTFTGDRAAASRYIEARLSKFALEVVFNPRTTNWKPSYDGRNKEPVTLPVKFPLLLAQGGEGIAVGLASKILPHNFIELIDASIAILKNEEFELFPDFPTAGMADFTRYNDGLRGGKVRIRAKISQLDKKTLVITDIPFGTTTTSLIDSILAANDKGKIKIRKIDDNTAANVEILVHLAQGVSPDQTIDALYAFTDCEVSISPNCCIIDEDKPRFIGISEILHINTQNTLELLKLELEIEKAELEEQWHFSSLEKIFIEKRIYHDIEECTTWEAVIDAIDKGLVPYKDMFMREITRDDIIRLTEIKIKRISKYDVFKADEIIKSIEDDITQVKYDLENLIEYAIAYFERIKAKYGKGRERKTEIRNFENIEAVMVAVANTKLYVNRSEGFAGSSLKKDEYVCDCSDIDDIIVFRADGTFVVFKMAEKIFVGENVIHIDIFRKNDDRTIYNMVYQDGPRGMYYVKRFAVKGVTRDKEYNLTRGTKGSKILYFTANPNGEAEEITIHLKPKPKLKKLSFEFDFSTLAIKGRNSQGNILTRHLIKRITKNGDGVSTLGARKIWYDESVQRLNVESRGILLGEFRGDDKILTVYNAGYIRLVNQDLSIHFDEDMILIEKYNPEKPLTAIYWDAESERYYVKRFLPEDNEKKQDFIEEYPGTKLIYFSSDWLPQLEIIYDNSQVRKLRNNQTVNLSEFIAVKGLKAKGKRLTEFPINKLIMQEPLPYEEPVTYDREDDDIPELILDSELSPEGRPDDSEEPEQLTLF